MTTPDSRNCGEAGTEPPPPVCDPPPTVEIAAIQGSGDATPIAGQFVRTGGVVTGDFNGTGGLGGFYIQDDTPDTDPATSDGIFMASTMASASAPTGCSRPRRSASPAPILGPPRPRTSGVTSRSPASTPSITSRPPRTGTSVARTAWTSSPAAGKEVAAILGISAEIGLMEVENNGTDAIKVAIICKSAAVTPIGVGQSSADPIFDRRPLIQTCERVGGSEPVTVVVNHF